MTRRRGCASASATDSAGRPHPEAPDTDAAEGCPVEAISLTPADSGEAFFPSEE